MFNFKAGRNRKSGKVIIIIIFLQAASGKSRPRSQYKQPAAGKDFADLFRYSVLNIQQKKPY